MSGTVVTGGAVGQVALRQVPVLPQPVRPVTAVSCSLAPHAVECRGLSESAALSTRPLADAGRLGAELGHRPRVDVDILDVDLGVKVQLRPVQQESVWKCQTLIFDYPSFHSEYLRYQQQVRDRKIGRAHV